MLTIVYYNWRHLSNVRTNSIYLSVPRRALGYCHEKGPKTASVHAPGQNHPLAGRVGPSPSRASSEPSIRVRHLVPRNGLDNGARRSESIATDLLQKR